MEPITPDEIAYAEADGAVSVNAEAVAARLNALLEAVQRVEQERDAYLALARGEQARREQAERRLAELRAAFIKHRTATHEVKPEHCVTCSRATRRSGQPSLRPPGPAPRGRGSERSSSGD